MALGRVGGDPLRIDIWHVQSHAVTFAVYTVENADKVFSALFFTQLMGSSATGPQCVQNYESFSHPPSIPPSSSGLHLNTSFL